MGTYVNKVDGARKPSILASEVGLITKTRLIPATLGTADGNRKVVKQGTIFPLNDNTAEGIVFEDVDVTNGDRVAAVIVAGRVYANRLPSRARTIAPRLAQSPPSKRAALFLLTRRKPPERKGVITYGICRTAERS